MGIDFWAGILIGFALTVVLWLFTVKYLVGRLQISESIEETKDSDGRFQYRFEVDNVGYRDAIDVSISCTLFSENWAQGPGVPIAVIRIPVSFDRIDVMPGRSWVRRFTRTARMIDDVGARLITLKLEEISDLQKRKLDRIRPNTLRARLEDRRMPLGELMNLGDKSFLSIVVYGYDRFSGTRSVTAYSEFQPDDVNPIA